MNVEFIGLIVSLLLTLMVFSYILGDNPLFKLAEHIFVGVSVGYAFLVILYQVIWPTFFDNATGLTGLLSSIPAAILCFLLIFKVMPTQNAMSSALGSIALAFLVGVGAALAIAGALFGTLYPQVTAVASIDFSPSNPAYASLGGQCAGSDFLSTACRLLSNNAFLSNIIVVIGTVGTLFYFTFVQKPQGPLRGFREGFVNFWAGMGRWVILITLGALFAHTVSARVALLVSRLEFLATGFQTLLGS